MTPVPSVGNQNFQDSISLPSPQDYETVLYFDSEAPDGGDGSLESPYNSIDMLMDQDFVSNSAFLIKAGSEFFISGLATSADHSNIYFGSYGEGAQPLIVNADDLQNPTQYSSGFRFYGDSIVVDGLHLAGATTNNYGRLIDIGATNLTFANCHIEGLPDPDVYYPFNIFKGGSTNMVLYRNEIAYARDDIWYASSSGTYKIISNYFHHANMGVFSADDFDPADRDTWQSKGGDIIQWEYPGLDGAYIANNFFDKSDAAGKFALIFNGGEENSNIVIEYNTILAPSKSFGGAGMQFHSLGILRHNIFINADEEGGGNSALASYPVFSDEIESNHFVGYTEQNALYNLTASDLGPGNLFWETITDYVNRSDKTVSVGSNLFDGLIP